MTTPPRPPPPLPFPPEECTGRRSHEWCCPKSVERPGEDLICTCAAPRNESSPTVLIDRDELERGLAIARATSPEPGPTLTADEFAALDVPDEPPTTPATPDAKRDGKA